MLQYYENRGRIQSVKKLIIVTYLISSINSPRELMGSLLRYCGGGGNKGRELIKFFFVKILHLTQCTYIKKTSTD